jgi:hypothetical protein
VVTQIKENVMKKLVASSLTILMWLGSTAVLADEPRVFQTSPVTAAEPGIVAEGAAWLKRAEDRVDGRVMATVDKANTPYSIWWVVFNNPAGCVDECGADDVFNMSGGAEADVAIFNASGAISAASGELKRNGKPAKGGVINVDLSVIAGEGAGNGSQNGPIPPGANETPPFFQRVLQEGNGLCAEIHIDINEHEFSGDWVQELTYPENPQAFAVFPPVEGCDE